MNHRVTPTARVIKAITLSLGSFVLLNSLGLATVQAGEYYKWTDKDGTVHFSEKPPEKSIKAEKHRTVVRAPVVEDVPDDVDENKDEKNAEEARPMHLQAVSTKDPQRCESERKRMQALKSNQRIRKVNKDGSFTYLNTDDIKREISRTQKAINEAC